MSTKPQAGTDTNAEKEKSALASFVQKTLSDMKTDLSGTALAMGRQGASELAIALKSFPDAIGPVDAVGTPYNPTQMQVSQEFGIYGRSATEPEQGMETDAAPMQSAPTAAPDKEPELEMEP